MEVSPSLHDLRKSTQAKITKLHSMFGNLTDSMFGNLTGTYCGIQVTFYELSSQPLPPSNFPYLGTLPLMEYCVQVIQVLSPPTNRSILSH